ncbi:MAG: glycosyltransferase, partial [Candidatus Ratteibacteria bacterium]
YFFAISKLNIKRLQKEMNINEKRIFLFPLGIDKKFSPMKTAKKSFTLGYLGGRISNENTKYALQLINAFNTFNKIYPDSSLIISGRDKFNKIENYIKRLGNKNINYIRFVPEEDIVKFYNSLDIFIFPSIYEGFGLPIMEAKRCGIPVMLMKDAMISEEIKEHTIAYASKDDLIEKLKYFYHNRKELEAIGKKSHLQAKGFTWKKSVQAAIKGYDKILKLK